jgi:hypothetical protein
MEGFMKWIGIGLLALVMSGCGSVPLSDTYKGQAQPQVDSTKALVYFYNYTQFQFGIFSQTIPGVHYVIAEGDEQGTEIARLRCSRPDCGDTGSYTWVYLPPGSHTFTAMIISSYESRSGTGIAYPTTLEAGKTYYFDVTQERAAYSPNLTISTASPDIAVQYIQKFKYVASIQATHPACIPNDVTVQQKRDVVDAYQTAHPEIANQPNYLIVLAALSDKWPCTTQ